MPASFNRWIGPCLILLGLAGCNNKENAPTSDQAVKAVQVAPSTDNAGKVIAAQTVSLGKDVDAKRFHESVVLDPPDDTPRPVDTTYNGKIAGKIFESIANDLWDKVVFTDANGKRIKYQAVLATEMGDIQIDLLGDIAPNHVRSFVCLARAGYFDGMTFYYSQNVKIEDNVSAYIESGSPKGISESGSGSIGYWLKRELSDKVTHEEGVIGACLDDCLADDPCTAACRFYVTAAKMPQMDGLFTIFGKVTRGMDIVRIINKREVFQENGSDGSRQNHLKQPVLIRNVTIHTTLAY